MISVVKKWIKDVPFLGDLSLKLYSSYLKTLPDEEYIKKAWKVKFGDSVKSPDLENPKTYNEKLQWEKLHSYNALAILCADKVGVLYYIKDKIGDKYINKAYGIYDDVSEINFDELPDQFVVKASHDSGSVLIVQDKSKIDLKELNKINKSLKRNWGQLSREWVYDNIKPHILVERYMEEPDGEALRDYKVFCFNGEPKMIQVDLDRFGDHRRNFYDLDWKRLPLETKSPNADYDPEKPELLEEMIELSRKLAKPFNHVRVDWYMYENQLVFGEMTFFHSSGFNTYRTPEWDGIMGSYFEVSKDLSY